MLIVFLIPDQKNVLKNSNHVLEDCKLTISSEPFKTKPKAKPRTQKKQEDKVRIEQMKKIYN